jgi:putative glutamine amidotransferase
MTHRSKPVVLMAADSRQIDGQTFHAVGHKYVAAVAQAAEAIPLVFPALGSDSELAAMLDLADGILLPGAVSNVHPSHFDEAVLNPALPLDPARDGTTLRLIKAAVAAGVPLLGICRGFQEINVAFGGSLYQAVHDTEGFADHREVDSPLKEEQYAPIHLVSTVPGGLLARLTGQDEFMVNSLHGQGIARLGTGLVAEAYAPDGLIEAVSISAAKAFALAVQWHPEWDVLNTPPYLSIFRAFGAACRDRAASRSTKQ